MLCVDRLGPSGLFLSPPPGSRAVEAGPRRTEQRDPQRIRVLVIDDTVAIHGDFRRILRDADPGESELDDLSSALFGGHASAPSRSYRFSVDAATQGEAGLSLLADALQHGDPYDVAFVDMRMPPGWNGVDTTARLWQADADLQVVLCTAYSDFRWDEVITALGTSRHLHLLRKPFSAEHARSMAEVLGVKARRLRALHDARRS